MGAKEGERCVVAAQRRSGGEEDGWGRVKRTWCACRIRQGEDEAREQEERRERAQTRGERATRAEVGRSGGVRWPSTAEVDAPGTRGGDAREVPASAIEPTRSQTSPKGRSPFKRMLMSCTSAAPAKGQRRSERRARRGKLVERGRSNRRSCLPLVGPPSRRRSSFRLDSLAVLLRASSTRGDADRALVPTARSGAGFGRKMRSVHAQQSAVTIREHSRWEPRGSPPFK